MHKLAFLIVVTFFHLSVFSKEMSEVDINVIPAAGNVYMLKGSGGNIGVLATNEGLLLVDDQFSPLAKRIELAMKSIVDKDLKYIINTHYHGDHTGGNSFFSDKAPIFAHQNVRSRLKAQGQQSKSALPVVTYQDGINIFLDDEEIKLTHLAHGHTDGDTAVYFKKANVLHTGDLFFEIGFPYIDLKSGGSVKGYLAAVHHLIENTPDDVVIIPGHGKLSDKAGLKAFAKMIEYSIALITTSLAEGKTPTEIIATGVKKEYKHLSWSFISEERWLKTLLADLG
jgi:cyclase